jgi:glutathione synthase/RimK-type ligase-like ATP-grasp enzyme
MDLVLQRADSLPRGSVQLPAGFSSEPVRTVRFGCLTARVTADAAAPDGVVRLAPDLWAKLFVPYDGMLVAVQARAPGEVEFGPTVAVLYNGGCRSLSRAEAQERLDLYYGHLGQPNGLLALGFEDAMDWDTGTMEGYLWDRSAGRPRLLRTRFPIPAVVRLTWAIGRDTIRHLRECTGERTFNWVRNIGKWQFHTLMSRADGLAEYLPDTRLFRGHVDLLAMLVRHGTVFVKHVFSIKGRGVARVRQTRQGFQVRHMAGDTVKDESFDRLSDLVPYLRKVVGAGRVIVQQGLPLAGRDGRAMHFRVLVQRDRAGRWRASHVFANVAPDERLVFTNVANGASEEEPTQALQYHHGMSTREAADCCDRMRSLCLRAAEVLAVPFHPLGLLGFDVGVDADTGRLWLLEANSVPGWGYSAAVDTDLARSQADYALYLTGFQP